MKSQNSKFPVLILPIFSASSAGAAVLISQQRYIAAAGVCIATASVQKFIAFHNRFFQGWIALPCAVVYYSLGAFYHFVAFRRCFVYYSLSVSYPFVAGLYFPVMFINRNAGRKNKYGQDKQTAGKDGFFGRHGQGLRRKLFKFLYVDF